MSAPCFKPIINWKFTRQTFDTKWIDNNALMCMNCFKQIAFIYYYKHRFTSRSTENAMYISITTSVYMYHQSLDLENVSHLQVILHHLAKDSVPKHKTENVWPRLLKLFWVVGMNPQDWCSSPPSDRGIFCLQNVEYFTRASLRESKMNAVACAQLKFQMLTLQTKI